jgi:hypothetical protein
MIKYNLHILTVSIAILNCDKAQDLSLNNRSEYSGIVYTNANGQILIEDIEDWQPRLIPLGIDSITGQFQRPSYFSVKPAFPNPAGIDSINWVNQPATIGCNIIYQIPIFSDVLITINVNQDSIIKNICDGKQATGLHHIYWDLKDDYGVSLPNGIYRMYFKIQTNDTTYTSFGDISIIGKQ